MKASHPQAALLRDLRRQIDSVDPGSAGFAVGLKAVGQAAWDALKLRKIHWADIAGQQTSYAYRVHVGGQEPGVAHVVNPPQRRNDRTATKTIQQFTRTCTWAFDKFTDAIDHPDTSSRNRLRCLTARSKFDGWVCECLDEIEASKVGKAKKVSPLAKFVEQHGAVHGYMGRLYPSADHVPKDAPPIPADHALVASMFDAAFAPGGVDEDAQQTLDRYIRGIDHERVEKGVTEPHANPRIEQLLQAERLLGEIPEPLPARGLHEHLGVSKSFLNKSLRDANAQRDTNGSYSRAEVLRALQGRQYAIQPARRPKKA